MLCTHDLVGIDIQVITVYKSVKKKEKLNRLYYQISTDDSELKYEIITRMDLNLF